MKAPAAAAGRSVQPLHALHGGRMGQSQAVSFWAAWPVWDWIKRACSGAPWHMWEESATFSPFFHIRGPSVIQQEVKVMKASHASSHQLYGHWMLALDVYHEAVNCPFLT